MLHWLRDAQLGVSSPRAHTVPPGWSATLARRLKLERTLEGHDGCVNTVQFSPDGQLLVSGSDDTQVFFWDWQRGLKLLGFASGHHNNVFQARIMPHSGNCTVVTCAADGVVRVAHVPQGAGGGAVETRRLACHRGRAHKLALERDSAHCFLSCGEDGEVRAFDLREPAAANRRLLACRTQRGRLELNSVACHPAEPQFCVGGGDPFVRVYDLRRVQGPGGATPTAEPLRRLCPWHLRGRRSLISITCAVYGQAGQVLATYNDENIYLFAADGQQPPPAVQAQQDEGRRRADAGGSSSGPEHKRARRASGSSRRERGGPGGEQQAAVMSSQQRRAAAVAALAEQRQQRAASGAAAAAEAHASLRRSLAGSDDEAEPLVGPQPPPAAAAARTAARSPDAAWLGRLPPPQAGGCEGAEAAAAVAGPAEPQALAQDAEAMDASGREEGEQPGSQQQTSSSSDGSARQAGGSGGNSEQGAASAPSSSASDSESEGGPVGWEGGEPEGIEVELDEGLEGSDEDDDEEDDEDDEEWEDEGELPQDALVDDADTAPPSTSRREGGDGERPSDSVLQAYKGHRNCRTVKGVSFLGAHDEFVMSGSDCGHIYVWDAASGTLQAMLKGDHDTVNCLEPHPHHLLTVATSGIEDTIKLWTPSAEEPQAIGPAQQRVMAANQRSQGEDRRMFISPQMLSMLLRARQLELVGGSASEDDDSGSASGSGSDEEGGRRRARLHPAADCTIM